jgi:hypothetical protein
MAKKHGLCYFLYPAINIIVDMIDAFIVPNFGCASEDRRGDREAGKLLSRYA